MTETVDPAVSSTPEDEPGKQDDDQAVTELIEQLARELGALGLCEAQLEAARNAPAVQRAARDGAGALVMVTAFLAAFVLLNVAALSGLEEALASWLAALALAAAWIVVGGVLMYAFVGRVKNWPLWRVFSARPSEAVKDLEQDREEAARAVRSTLARLGPAFTIEIAMAAVPMANGIAGGVVDAGDALLDASDDIVDSITDDLPAGGVVNQMWDVALVPGRFGLRVATSVLKRETPED